MRRYAYLKEPVKTNKKDYIYKIMLYQTKKDGVCLFMYCQKDAVQCSFDYWYKTLEDVYEDWNELIDENGWIDFDDPLPDCQHDAFLPIRVKGVILVNRSGENWKFLKMANGKTIPLISRV